MGERFLRPSYDFMIKLLFGDERNVHILTQFLKAILKIPHHEYDTIEIIDPHLLRDYKEDKLGILDIKLTLKSGKIVYIEVQVKEGDEFKKRIVYYNAKTITEQLKDGWDYEKLNPVISIVITDFQLIQESPSYMHHFTLYDSDRQVQLTDLTEIYILELPKLPEESDGTEAWVWSKLLYVRSKEELDMVAVAYPQLQDVKVEIMKLSQDERAKMLHDAKVKQERDRRAQDSFLVRTTMEKGRQQGLQQGISQGLNQGLHQAARSIAIKLLSRNTPIEHIIEDTGLTKAEIEALTQELH